MYALKIRSILQAVRHFLFSTKARKEKRNRHVELLSTIEYKTTNVRIFMKKSLTFCNNIVIISFESKIKGEI